MRKVWKKKIKDFLNLMEEAHNEIEKEVEKRNGAMVQELLGQCQEGAIRIGDLIESSEEGETKAIELLEEYCELVYTVHQNMLEGGHPKGGKFCKDLRVVLKRVQERIDSLKIRIEAVFLPYKAAMWDSLESVWKEAEADPDCDAYVVPIPYYDRNPDGSFGEKHDESGLYPEYVPIVKYDAYDFAFHKPDIIFIHNPYDGGNYVTSVHPFFYSSNLKKYTDCLVYIPYFIKDEMVFENLQGTKKIEDYCMVPGVVNADKVIVQSKEMKKAYIDILTGYTGRNTFDYWERKIAGLGSPKLEKVRNTGKKDICIPAQWADIMKKRGGKVVLYNTHLNLLMERNYKYFIPKLRETLDYFKSRDDILLLWRPHPLSLAAAESMNPCAADIYRSIVKAYREEGWGIYDDTPDLGRAIALSDAYYGSISSVLTLYKETGKPILIHKIDIAEEKYGDDLCNHRVDRGGRIMW